MAEHVTMSASSRSSGVAGLAALGLPFVLSWALVLALYADGHLRWSAWCDRLTEAFERDAVAMGEEIRAGLDPEKPMQPCVNAWRRRFLRATSDSGAVATGSAIDAAALHALGCQLGADFAGAFPPG